MLDTSLSLSTLGGDSRPTSAFPSPRCVSVASLVEGQSPDNHLSKKILLIDDTPSIIKVVGRLLTSNGHIVDTAINGHQGLEKLKRSYHTRDTTSGAIDSSAGDNTPYLGYDLVLSDLQVHPVHTLANLRPSLNHSLLASLSPSLSNV